MKHITTIILFSICFLVIGSMSYAQGRGKGYGRGASNGAAASDTVRGPYYVDNDGDGICDNAGSYKGKGRQGRRLGPKDGTGKGGQRGANFVDNNGDGICDNRQQNQDKTD
jgi:hypothetical protein